MATSLRKSSMRACVAWEQGHRRRRGCVSREELHARDEQPGVGTHAQRCRRQPSWITCCRSGGVFSTLTATGCTPLQRACREGRRAEGRAGAGTVRRARDISLQARTACAACTAQHAHHSTLYTRPKPPLPRHQSEPSGRFMIVISAAVEWQEDPSSGPWVRGGGRACELQRRRRGRTGFKAAQPMRLPHPPAGLISQSLKGSSSSRPLPRGLLPLAL